MKMCIFEDQGTQSLAPLTLTRPAFDLWCGASQLLDAHCRSFPGWSKAVLVRPSLADLCRLGRPSLPVNDLTWLQDGSTLMINARWLPPTCLEMDPAQPHVGLLGGQVAYAILNQDQVAHLSMGDLDEHLTYWASVLPRRDAGGQMINYPWDLISYNADTVRRDFAELKRAGNVWKYRSQAAVIGSAAQISVHPQARIDPFVVFDVTNGPIIVDADAVIQSFSRLEGPCYIGKGTWILGAKVRGSTIGPACRIGGEVEATIIQGYSNKAHDGFLGHSYLGEWVNIGAGTQFSDLRNDYASIRVTIDNQNIDTGLMKVGSFVGDHTKTGLNTLVNTGTVIGAFGHLLPSGTLAPKVIPSFSTLWNGQLREQTDLDAMLRTASTVMRRRGCELVSVHEDFFRWLYKSTHVQRHQVISERQRPRWRLSG